MISPRNLLTALAVIALFTLAGCAVAPVTAQPGAVAAADPLPSWNEGPAKASILDFVAAVTDPAGPTYVPPDERIAVTDNDGTLWTESPLPVQAAFVFQRIVELAPEHPEWQTTQPYQAVLEHDAAALASLGQEEIEQLMAATHAGMTVEEFDATVKDFLATARDPRFGLLYTEAVYQPMLEVLDLLRANDFDVFIVSGGGVDFMRAFAGEVYAIPPQNVIGSSLQTEFQQTPEGAVLVRLPELVAFNDREQKPVNIQLHIGRRPILALGNSDGDLAMFQYTAGGGGPYLNVLVVHDDPEREYESLTGTDAVMAATAQSPWTFASMKNDWKTVYPVEPSAAEAVEAAPAGEWQTFTNAAAGFRLQAPPGWIEETLPDENDGMMHGTSFSGPEGGVEVRWGMGFGGACPQGTEPVQLAQQETTACHITAADGTQMWTQIYYVSPEGNYYGAHAWTNDADEASAGLLLDVLATLAFMPPAEPEAAAGSEGAAIANPAAQNCVAQGGMLSIVDREDGGQFGICFFEDNRQCEEWALLRGECPAGGVKVTGYVTPAAAYYAITGSGGAADEQGTCTLPGGALCDAWEYYNGACSR